MLRLFDTAEAAVVPFRPRDPGRVSMYVCGPTVYGPPHLGHGRMALVFDILRRYLEWSGMEVTFVSNITDIDDKIINRAQAEGRDTEEVALQNEALWYEAIDAIGVKRPTSDPHATAYVDRMVDLIADLMDRGFAYETGDGVYFAPAGVKDYGRLARQSLDSLRAGARVEANDQKRSPIDFALWKKAKPGEPAWDSPWGRGRPGWHTECVVMSLDLLGDGFDLHGGGQDLAFPHHENERAQALAGGHAFARHWMHNGFVEVGGQKMAKSLGNFTNLADLIASHDPRALRLLVLRAHYRSPLEVTRSTVEDASRALARLDAMARRAAAAGVGGSKGYPDPDAAALEAFRAAMDDDLDTPTAVAVMFTTVKQANEALDAEDRDRAAALVAAVQSMAGAVGLVIGADDEDSIPDDIVERAHRRDAARASRDWATADRLRDEIVARGYVVEDTSEGTKVRPA